MKKLLNVLPFLILFSNCIQKKVTCQEFDEKYAMFIPMNMVANDTITFYSNEGDSSVFFQLSPTKKINKVSDCDDERECDAGIRIIYIDKNNPYNEISYFLNYSGNNPNEIWYRVGYHTMNDYVDTYFTYNPTSSSITGSLTIEDSIAVNSVYYKDVVILSGKKIFSKIYVAKDEGIIMATVKNSDVVWTITKPQ